MKSFSLLSCTFYIVILIASNTAAPVDPKKSTTTTVDTNHVSTEEPNDVGVEYNRYLQEVVQLLESDSDFRKKLEKAEPEDIRTGKVAKELEYVSHHVRNKLDELKRQEIERLRHLAVQEYERSRGLGIPHEGSKLKIPGHLDHKNPSFEVEDLRKLIVQTTKDLEESDRQRKESFKEYEMQKEFEHQAKLKELDEEKKKVEEKAWEEAQKKHKQHPKLHHPGSKQQYEEVWEEQDHLSPENFNPKTFFHMHDLDGNGYWDQDEVKALFAKELDKVYDPNAPEDDMAERYEEMERMREHVFNETDTNRDYLISFGEFLEQTRKQEFQKDPGWNTIDEEPVYNQQEYMEFERRRQMEIQRLIDQGLLPPHPGMMHPNNAPYGMPPQPMGGQYGVPPPPPPYQAYPPQPVVPQQMNRQITPEEAVKQQQAAQVPVYNQQQQFVPQQQQQYGQPQYQAQQVQYGQPIQSNQGFGQQAPVAQQQQGQQQQMYQPPTQQLPVPQANQQQAQPNYQQQPQYQVPQANQQQAQPQVPINQAQQPNYQQQPQYQIPQVAQQQTLPQVPINQAQQPNYQQQPQYQVPQVAQQQAQPAAAINQPSSGNNPNIVPKK